MTPLLVINRKNGKKLLLDLDHVVAFEEADDYVIVVIETHTQNVSYEITQTIETIELTISE